MKLFTLDKPDLTSVDPVRVLEHFFLNTYKNNLESVEKASEPNYYYWDTIKYKKKYLQAR